MPSVEQIPDGKRQLNILLSNDLYNQLIAIAPSYYGKGRGGLSRLVEDAVRFYLQTLGKHNSMQNGFVQVNKINPSMSVREEYNKFIKELRRVWEMNWGTELPVIVRRSIIEHVMLDVFKRAKDERTRLRKLHTWFLQGLVKPYDPPFRPQKPSEWKKVVSIELVSRNPV